MELKVYQASFVLNEFHRQATDVIDPPPPTIWKTVSGNPIQILDAVSSTMQKCVVTLEPIQAGSGIPSPANPRPITGWSGTALNVSGSDTSNPTTYSVTFPAFGKNLCNPDAIEQVYTTASNIRNGIEFSKVGTYVVSASDYNSGSIRVKYRFSDGTFASASIISDSETKTYKKYTVLENEAIIVYDNSSTNTIEQSKALFEAAKIQIEAGNSQTTYEPYTNTVYGGTYDFVSGDGGNDRIAIVFDGTEAWGKNGNYGYYLDDAQFQLLSDDAPISNYCDGYAPGSGSGLNTWSLRLNTSKASLLVKPDTAVYDTTAKWKTYLAGHPLQVVFKRNESIPFTSTPQQVSTNDGENNVWGDGTIELTYLGLE